MAIPADGYIRISTKIDTAPAETGLKSLTSSLKGFATMLKTTLGLAAVKKVINFGQATVDAATKFKNAMVGLKSIVEGQARSFQQANKFIKEYISDGLVPATSAITAYKNLAARGYGTEQIEKTMIALKNAAAFGRNASLSLGDAVSSATEGLKNENSVLVDNSGVTKNVSVMWKEYADSIGVGVNSLTKQQKIQAEVNGIMEETKFQMGDAAKLANEYSGQTAKLEFGLNDLKIAIGNALIPILQAILPHINNVISALTRMANKFASVTQFIFGTQIVQQDNIAESADNATDSVTKLGEATKKAGDKAKKGLAKFDELNVLSDTSSTGGDTALSDISAKDKKLDKEKDEDNNLLKGIKLFYDFGKALKGLQEVFAELGDSLNYLWNDTGFGDFVSLLGQAFVIAGINILTGALKALSGVFDVVSGSIKWFIGMITGDTKTAAEGTKKIFEGIGKIIEGVFIALLGKEVVDSIKKFFSEWGKSISDWWNNDVAPWFTAERWSKLWEDTKKWFADGWNSIVTWWATSTLVVWWNENVAPWFTIEKWMDLFDNIRQGLQNKWYEIVDWWSSSALILWWTNDVQPWFNLEKWMMLLDSIRTSFATKWSETVESWKTSIADWWTNHVAPWFTVQRWFEATSGIKDGFVKTFQNAIETVRNHINKFIGWLNDHLKFSWDDFYIGGIKLFSGGSIRLVNIPEIPRLAQGAVIPPNREFMAILGDQRRGVNIETPLDTMIQAFKTALSEMGGAGGTGDTKVYVEFSGTLAKLGQLLEPVIRVEQARKGPTIVKVGAANGQ